MSNHFEAKLHAYRRTQDGAVVSFVIHPNDVTADLATAPLGTRFMIGFAEIEAAVVQGSVQGQAEPGGDTGFSAASTIPKKPRTPFHDLPPSQQCVLRCQDRDFRRYLTDRGYMAADEDQATITVKSICAIKSRAELNLGAIHYSAAAYHTWNSLLSKFESWKLTQKYADVLR